MTGAVVAPMVAVTVVGAARNGKSVVAGSGEPTIVGFVVNGTMFVSVGTADVSANTLKLATVLKAIIKASNDAIVFLSFILLFPPLKK
jgi:hypothetical protein